MALLGDVIEQIRGVSYKPKDLRNRDDIDAVALLRANNIQNGEIVLDEILYVSADKVNKRQYLRKGDILVCTSSGSKDLVGKAAFVHDDLPYVFGAFCKVMRPTIDYPRYIGYFFQSPYYRNKISDASAGANINNLRSEHFDKLMINLPPLDRQREIAAVLDKISELSAKRKNQLDKLDELIKARFVEMFGDPDKNNLCWDILPLGQLFTVGSSKRIYQRELTNVGVPFLRIADLMQRIERGAGNTELHIAEERYQQLKQHGFVPSAGDILVTSRGTLGMCYEVKANDKFYFQDGMISWLSRRNPAITVAYIIFLFQMPSFRKQIDAVPIDSTVNYLSLERLKNLRIMCPPIEIQQKFAAFIECVEKPKSAINCSLEKLETLKKSLMQEYFG